MFRYLLILFIASIWLRCSATTDPWDKWLAPELKSVEFQRKNALAELEEMGTPVLRQTAPEIGYQREHVKTLPLTPDWLQVDLGKLVLIDTIVMIPAILDVQSTDQSANAFPLRFEVAISDDPRFEKFTLIKSFNDVDFPNPGVAPVSIAVKRKFARYVRISVSKMTRDNDTFFFALGEIMVISGNLDVAINCPVQAPASVEMSPRFSKAYLVDGRTHLGPPIKRDYLAWDGLHAGEVSNAAPPFMQLDLGRIVPIQQVRLHPTHARRGADVSGFRFPRSFLVEASKTADFANPTVLLDVQDFINPGDNAITIPASDIEARYVRMTSRFKNSAGGPRFSLSEFEVYSGDTNIARNAVVSRTPDNYSSSRNWPLSILTDGYTSSGRLMELPVWLKSWDRRVELQRLLIELDQREKVLLARAHERATWLVVSFIVIFVVAVFTLLAISRIRTTRELFDVRTRLARDIHDHVGSNLAGIAVLSEVARENQQLNTGQREDWNEVSHVARETLDVMREVIWLIGDKKSGGLDLMTQMELAATRMLAGKSFSWRSRVAQLPPTLNAEARRDIFLLFKEALTNIVRHSNATNVELAAEATPVLFRLSIVDDGCGFDQKSARAGIGLNSQRMRAQALGGKVRIVSSPGRGTGIYLDVPLGKLRTHLRFLNKWRTS